MDAALRHSSFALLTLFAAALSADTWLQPQARPATPEDTEFRFVRLVYSGDGLRFGGRERWLTDWPDAEQHLMGGVRRLTRIDAAQDVSYLSIMDERLFDYPWLYAVEVGSWVLSDEEAARLREYLLRGGFLVVDDFHGSLEWAGFVQSMHRVFPDRTIVDIPPEDAVFHRLRHRRAHPDTRHPVALQRPHVRARRIQPHWRGIYDDDGRLMVVINFNMDLGDAWEHADVPDYALQYTTRAYKYAINYILYAMTHRG